MAIKIPQYIIREAPTEQSFVRRYWLLITLLVLIPISFVGGLMMGNGLLSDWVGSANSLQNLNQQLENENQQLLSRNSLLDTEAKVKQQAILELQESYNTLLVQNSELQSEVNFFQNLLVSNNNAKGLRIFDIDWTQINPGQYILTLTLAQKLQKAQPIEGDLKLIVKGQLQTGEQTAAKEVVVNEKFAFKYYQMIRQTFNFEEGFYPLEVLVELTTDEKKPRSLSQTYQWLEIAENH
ncbi:DUF6776 family protein [Marinicella sp. W31]|uniref:DUF6776 family protein n=1 Tax=Marinicella sp. W31 TaxID=3023713 RepID=UPI003757229D